jgi:bacterioferritin-associated ferredoxin
MKNDRIICTCLDIKQSQIENAIKEKKLTSIEEVQDATTAGTVCGGCVDDIYILLEKINKSVKI